MGGVPKSYTAYKHRHVAKCFPGYGDEPFKGKVTKVDTKDKDGRPFHITYEDGDAEWVSLEELKAILVDDDAPTHSTKKRSRAASKPEQQQTAAEAAMQPTSAKRLKGNSKADADPAAAEANSSDDEPTGDNKGKAPARREKSGAQKEKAAAGEQEQAAAAPAPAADGDQQGFDAERAKRQLKQQQQEHGLGGMTNFTLTAGAVRAAEKAGSGRAERPADKENQRQERPSRAGEKAAAAADDQDLAAGFEAAGQESKQQGRPSRVAVKSVAAGTGATADKDLKPNLPVEPAGSASAADATAVKEQQQDRLDKAAAAAGGSGRSAPAKAAAREGKAAGSGGAPTSPSIDTQGVLADIHQAAQPPADMVAPQQPPRQVAQMPYHGPGASVLPAMSQAVLVDGCVEVSLLCPPRPRGSSTSGRSVTSPQQQQQPCSTPGGSGHDYVAEAAALLAELDKVLLEAKTDKSHLIRVRVTLRSMQDGLTGFTEAWNRWVDRNALPIMTLVEGAGPITRAGIMLEAKAMVPTNG